MKTTKQIFEELMLHLADNVPSIKVWDEWNGQFDDVDEAYSVAWPAGAIDLDFKFEAYGERSTQKAMLVLTIYLAENELPDTHLKVGIAPNTYSNAVNLSLFDYAEEVFQALQDRILTHSKWWVRVTDTKANYRAHGLRGRKLVYHGVSVC